MGWKDKKENDNSNPVPQRSARIFVSFGGTLIVGAEVICNGRTDHTGDDGSVVFFLEDFDKNNLDIIVRKEGYKEFHDQFPNYDVTKRVMIQLVEVDKKWIPTWDEIKNFKIKTSIVSGYEGDSLKFFTAHYLLWSDDTLNEWIALSKAQGWNAIIFNLFDASTYGNFDFTDKLDFVKARMDKLYENHILPIPCMNVAEINNGKKSVAFASSLLNSLKPFAVFPGWEIECFDGPCQYTYDELQQLFLIIHNYNSSCRILFEPLQPQDRDELMFSDRRGQDGGLDWYRNTNAKYITDLCAELPYKWVQGDKEAWNHLIFCIGENYSRLHGLFPIPDKYPNGTIIPDAVKEDWRTTYGLNLNWNLFEYASYLRWSDAQKLELRKYIQTIIPIEQFGEG